MSSSNANSFAPLLEVLNRILFWVESHPPTLIVAARTLAEFRRQELPPGSSVTKRKLIGTRLPMRGRLPSGAVRTQLARWPQDRLVEAALPSLYFVASGQADIRIANYVVHCPVGSLLFVPGGVPKSDGSRPLYEEITPHSFCDVLIFSPGQVNGEGLECSISHSKGKLHEAGGKEEACWIKNRLVAQLFAGFAHEAQNEGNAKSTFQLLACMLFHLRRDIERGGAFASWRHPVGVSLADQHDPIKQALEYMTTHIGTSLSIDHVARHIGFSRRAFTSRFREQTGQTFNATLTRLRLERATVLLLETKLEINKVSEMVGLGSDQLRHLFRQYYQCTPGEFRTTKKMPENKAIRP